MRDIATNSVPVSSAVKWRPGAAVSPPAAPTLKRFDDRHLTIVAFLNQLAGARLRIVSDALIEATSLPPRLRLLNVTAANDNGRRGITVLNHYRLNRSKNSFIGGRHG